MGIKVNEQYGYFNSLDPSAEGAGDKRTYSADQWAQQWELCLSDGIMGGGDNLRVVPADAAYPLCTGILPGWGLIKGRHYRLYLSEEIGQDDPPYKLMQHMPAANHPRIDLVVLRLNLQQTLEGRWIRPMVLTGIEAEDPTPPTLTRSTEEWDISLAMVRVEPGQTEIGVLDIIDERFDAEMCGIIGSLMQIDLSPYVQQMQALVADGMAQVDDLIASIQLAWEVQTGNINADWEAFKAGLVADGYLPEYGQRLHAAEQNIAQAQTDIISVKAIADAAVPSAAIDRAPAIATSVGGTAQAIALMVPEWPVSIPNSAGVVFKPMGKSTNPTISINGSVAYPVIGKVDEKRYYTLRYDAVNGNFLPEGGGGYQEDDVITVNNAPMVQDFNPRIMLEYGVYNDEAVDSEKIAICVRDGYLYLQQLRESVTVGGTTYYNPMRLRKINIDTGQLIWSRQFTTTDQSSDKVKFVYPYLELVAATDGSLYAAMTTGMSIPKFVKLTSSGYFGWTWGTNINYCTYNVSGFDNPPNSLYVDNEGSVYGFIVGELFKASPTGTLLSRVAVSTTSVNNGSRGMPIQFDPDGFIYAVSGGSKGGAKKINPATGAIVWQKPYSNIAYGRYVPELDLVILLIEITGQIIALRPDNGNVLWTKTIDPYIGQSVRYSFANISINNKDVYIVDAQGKMLYKINIDNGLVWYRRIDGITNVNGKDNTFIVGYGTDKFALTGARTSLMVVDESTMPGNIVKAVV